MNVKCRFKNCDWSGHQDDLFTHCEDFHRQRIIELSGEQKNFWLIHIDELRGNNPFLLCARSGIYWFAPGEHIEENVSNWGVFHIGDSEPIEYTLKLGELRHGHCEYFGPLKSRPDNAPNDQHDLVFAFDYLDYMKAIIENHQVLIYLGDFDDSDDVYEPTCDDLEFDEEDEKLNKLCVANFTCVVCYEYIRRDIRFCDNKHFVCLHCFDRMNMHGKLRCPVCRVNYSYDCSSADLERFLRMVKFPKSSDTDELVEVPKKQKKPNAEEKQRAVTA